MQAPSEQRASQSCKLSYLPCLGYHLLHRRYPMMISTFVEWMNDLLAMFAVGTAMGEPAITDLFHRRGNWGPNRTLLKVTQLIKRWHIQVCDIFKYSNIHLLTFLPQTLHCVSDEEFEEEQKDIRRGESSVGKWVSDPYLPRISVKTDFWGSWRRQNLLLLPLSTKLSSAQKAFPGCVLWVSLVPWSAAGPS